MRFATAAIAMWVVLVGCATQAEQNLNTRSSYVAMQVTADDAAVRSLAGKLNFPANNNGAAVLIVHGSGGIDTRGELHTRSLNQAGFITLEIDLWAARGWVGSKLGRPQGVPETLPDVLRARDYLSTVDGVDAARIGILGFSWGGVVAMLTTERSHLATYGPSQGFAAHVAFYPVCWVYNTVPGYELVELGRLPLLILTGAKDAYDEPTTCTNLRGSIAASQRANVDVVVYPNAAHAFNTHNPKRVVQDPFSHLGAGGEVLMEGNATARAAADQATTGFFSRHLLSAPLAIVN